MVSRDLLLRDPRLIAAEPVGRNARSQLQNVLEIVAISETSAVIASRSAVRVAPAEEHSTMSVRPATEGRKRQMQPVRLPLAVRTNPDRPLFAPAVSANQRT